MQWDKVNQYLNVYFKQNVTFENILKQTNCFYYKKINK